MVPEVLIQTQQEEEDNTNRPFLTEWLIQTPVKAVEMSQMLRAEKPSCCAQLDTLETTTQWVY
jgi:hypothetical protein